MSAKIRCANIGRMEPYGDPEARIRDLERPLADQAHSNELGTHAYEAPPPPTEPAPAYQYGTPPPAEPYPTQQPYGQYGSPYYAAPQQVVHKRSQTAVWLIPLVVIAIIGAGVVAMVLFFSLGSPGPSPTISGGGGQLDGPQVPDVPQIPPIPQIDPPGGATDEVITVEAGGSVSIGGVDKVQTIVCNDGTVNISGVQNSIEVQGSCAVIHVSGVENNVTIESSGSINTSGFDNRVTYRGGDPEISTSGTGNVVEQG